MAHWEKSRRLLRQIREVNIPLGSFEVVSIFLLYSIAVLSFIVGACFSSEWADQAVSTKFMLTGVIIPLTSVAVAFGVQILALRKDAKHREQRDRHEAKFLAGLDRCHGGSIVSRNFLGHLLDQWDAQMKSLSKGVVTIQDNYWSVCAQLYALAKNRVECTSYIPLEEWEKGSGSKGLLDYKRMQIECLINRHIYVGRTFIIDSIKKVNVKQFLEIVSTQLKEGFCIYYIDLSQTKPGRRRQLLARDFGLIDDLVLMLGRQSSINRGVYYYDFFELGSSAMHPSEHAPALDLMSNRREFFANGHAELHIEQARRRIDKFPMLNEPEYEIYRDAIMSQVEAIKCW